MATASYSTDSEGNGVIDVSAGNYSGSLIEFLNNNSWNANTQNLTIQGAGVNSSTWIDFQFDYTTHGYPGALHIKDIKFLTSSVDGSPGIDGYAVYSRDTRTTMSNVTISGYTIISFRFH